MKAQDVRSNLDAILRQCDQMGNGVDHELIKRLLYLARLKLTAFWPKFHSKCFQAKPASIEKRSISTAQRINIIESLAAQVEALKGEVQELRDENNRLKGEQGKPDIKANKRQAQDISSEAERKQAQADADMAAGIDESDVNGQKKRNRESKLTKVKIDHEQICQRFRA